MSFREYLEEAYSTTVSIEHGDYNQDAKDIFESYKDKITMDSQKDEGVYIFDSKDRKAISSFEKELKSAGVKVSAHI